MKVRKINVDNIIRQLKKDPSILNKLSLAELKKVTEKLNLDKEILDKRKKIEFIGVLENYLEPLKNDSTPDSESEDLFDEEVEIEDEMNVCPARTCLDLAIKVADKTIDICFKVLEILVLSKIAGSGKKK
jgi:hypothetical protein